jgi:hypothetical protein
MAMAADRRNSPDSQLDWLWTYTVGRAVLAAGSSPLGSEFEAVGGVGDGTDLDRFGGGAESVRNRFEWKKADVFYEGFAVSNYLIRGVMDRGELAMVFGPSGAGKTFMVMDMVFALARGLPFWRSPEHKIRGAVPVWYVCAEGAFGFKKRIKAYAIANGLSDLEMGALPLWILADRPDFHKSDDDVRALALSVGQGASGGLIVIDTMAQVASGADENSSEMSDVISRCQALAKTTGAMVLLVHHSGKDLEKGARGWSGLKGPLDTQIRVNGESGVREKVMTNLKMKDGEDGAVYDFHLEVVQVGVDEDLDPITSCVVAHDLTSTGGQSMAKAPRVNKTEELLRDLIDRIKDINSKPDVWATEEAIRVEKDGRNIARSDIKGGLERLMQQGRVELKPKPRKPGSAGSPGKGYYNVIDTGFDSDCDDSSDF